MSVFLHRALVLLLLSAALIAAPHLEAGQAIVQHQNLSQMCDNAARIYRGEVLGVEESTVTIGSGEFPATAYQIKVTEGFLGDVDQQKDGVGIVELKMIGTNKRGPMKVEGDLAVLSVLPAPPQLAVGEEYLLLTNAPNANGLAYTIGMEQGSFRISGSGKVETAVNALDNVGLFAGMAGNYPARGPIDYATLADAIRNQLGQ